MGATGPARPTGPAGAAGPTGATGSSAAATQLNGYAKAATAAALANGQTVQTALGLLEKKADDNAAAIASRQLKEVYANATYARATSLALDFADGNTTLMIDNTPFTVALPPGNYHLTMYSWQRGGSTSRDNGIRYAAGADIIPSFGVYAAAGNAFNVPMRVVSSGLVTVGNGGTVSLALIDHSNTTTCYGLVFTAIT